LSLSRVTFQPFLQKEELIKLSLLNTKKKSSDSAKTQILYKLFRLKALRMSLLTSEDQMMMTLEMMKPQLSGTSYLDALRNSDKSTVTMLEPLNIMKIHLMKTKTKPRPNLIGLKPKQMLTSRRLLQGKVGTKDTYMNFSDTAIPNFIPLVLS